jgi:hypothetical protein
MIESKFIVVKTRGREPGGGRVGILLRILLVSHGRVCFMPFRDKPGPEGRTCQLGFFPELGAELMAF